MDRNRRKIPEVVPRRQGPAAVSRWTKYPEGAQLIVGDIGLEGVPALPVTLTRRNGRWWIVASNTNGPTWVDLDALREFCMNRDLWNAYATQLDIPPPTRKGIAERLLIVARRIRLDAGCDDPEVPDNPEVLLCAGELTDIAQAVYQGAAMPPLILRLDQASYALRDRVRELKKEKPDELKRLVASTPELDQIEDMMRQVQSQAATPPGGSAAPSEPGSEPEGGG